MWRLVLIETRQRWQHIIPVDDEVEHGESRSCVCGPKPHRRTADDGSAYTQWEHFALDGRSD